MTTENKKVLGVLGGLGPMSSAYFYKMLTEKTRANQDQDHLDMVISSRSSTPDRTNFILGISKENPLPIMIDEAHRLVNFGAEVIALTCNTAHYFYENLQAATTVPILNIGALAVSEIEKRGIHTVGLLATSGTVKCGIYQHACDEKKIACLVPSEQEQERVMHIIYEEIKSGKKPDLNQFFALATALKTRGAETIILGCTELSLIKQDYALDESFIDPLEILAEASIIACGHQCV
ncbi:MAG: amino acid racemase [Oscillospiraceae bacterium]